MSSPIKTGLLAIGALVLALQDKHLQNRLDAETFTAEIKAITDKVDELQALPDIAAGEPGAPVDLQPITEALGRIAFKQDEIVADLAGEAVLRDNQQKDINASIADLKPILQAIADKLDQMQAPLPTAQNANATEAAGDLLGDSKGKGKSESKAA